MYTHACTHICIFNHSGVVGGEGGGAKPQGGTIFSHIRRLGPFLLVQNSEFQYFLGFSKKNDIFWGYEDFVDILGGHHKIGLVRGSFLCNLWSFFKVKVQN